MSNDLSNLTACVVFAVYGMARTSLVAALEEEEFLFGALTIVGLTTATPLCSDHFLWWLVLYPLFFICWCSILSHCPGCCASVFLWLIKFSFNLVVILFFIFFFILKRVTGRLYYLIYSRLSKFMSSQYLGGGRSNLVLDIRK